MSYTTPQELERRARDVEAAQQEQLRRDRLTLLRECPRSLVLDDAHLFSVARGEAGVNNQHLLDHTFRVRAIVALGIEKPAAAAALGLTLTELEHELTRDLYWAAPADVLEPLGELTRATYGAGPTRRA